MLPSPFPAPEWVHFSNLKHIAKSAAHYLASLTDHGPNVRASKRSFGSLCHARILGRGNFAVFDGKVRRGKAWTAFKKDPANAGKDLVLKAEWERAGIVAEKVFRHRTAARMLDGKREVDLEWVTVTGRKAAGRIDCIPERGVTELKMSFTSDPRAFVFQALRMQYIAQGAWYRSGLEAKGAIVDDVNYVVVEPVRPFAITCFKLSPRTMLQGAEVIREWLAKLQMAEATKTFPEYASDLDVVELDIPESGESQLVGFDDDEEAA